MGFRQFLNSLAQGQAGGYGPPVPGPSNYMYGQPSAVNSQAAPCQRKQPQAGFQDWVGLNDHRFPDFLICLPCYNAHVRLTQYANYFITKSVHPHTPVRCDMSRFWVGMAGLVLMTMNQDQRYDVTLLARVAKDTVPEGPCPNSQLKGEDQPLPVVSRSWHSLVDPWSRTWQLQGWTVCSSCVANMQTLCPNMAPGLAAEAGGPRAATCALVPSDDYTDQRTAQILQHFATGAVMTAMTGRYDANALLGFLRANPPPARGGSATTGAGAQESGNGLCPRNKPSTTLKCHAMIGFSDFTVCEQCFTEVVKPDLDNRVELACQFDATPRAVPSGFTCQLYSDRMRQVWKDCASTTNTYMLHQKVNERRAKERELQIRTTQLQEQAKQLKEQADMKNHLAALTMRSESNRASNNILLSGVGVTYQVDAHHYVRPDTSVDFTQVNQMNNQAAMLQVQAAQVEGQVKIAQQEWERFWE